MAEARRAARRRVRLWSVRDDRQRSALRGCLREARNADLSRSTWLPMGWIVASAPLRDLSLSVRAGARGAMFRCGMRDAEQIALADGDAALGPVLADRIR